MGDTLRGLLAKAVDALSMDRGVDLIELERQCIAAAIARMGAGDGLVERLLENDREIFLPLLGEAAAHIAALTAQNREMALDVLASSGQAQEAYAAQLAVEVERDALRAKVARLEGDKQGLCDQIGKLLNMADEADKEMNGEDGLSMHSYGMTPDWFVEAAFWSCYGYGPSDPRAALTDGGKDG